MKRKCKFLALLLAGCILLNYGCGRETSQTNPSNSENSDSAMETGNETVDAQTEEEENKEELSGVPEVKIEKLEKDWYDEETKQWILHSEYEMVSVDGNVSEALKESVQKWSEENESQVISTGDQAISEYPIVPEEENENDNYHYSLLDDLELYQSNSRVLSFLQRTESYFGGAHGNYEYTGINFDVQTGKILELDDILKDTAGFQEFATDYVIKKLEQECADGLFPDYLETLEGMWEEPIWYLDAEGLNIVFNPYVIGPYALGAVFVTIPYQEISAYYNPDYGLPDSKEGVAFMPENQEISLSLIEEKDSLDTVSILTEYKDDYSDAQITLKVNDSSIEVGTFARFGRAYLLHRKDGSVFVLFDADYASDDYVTFLYEITNGIIKESDRVENLDLYDGVVNTELLTLNMHLNVIGTYHGQMDYVIDQNGTLTQQNEIFEINSKYDLTTMKELPVLMDGQDEEELLPVGSCIRIVGTDNKEKAYFEEVKTQKRGCISFVRGNGADDDWTIYIHNIEDYEYFEMVPYAG